MAIEIRDGKFYKDGVEVKPTFGDTEQIRVLKEAERKAKEKKVDAKLISEEVATYYAVVKFKCPSCKYENSVDLLDDDPSEWDIDNSDVDQLECECGSCHLDFTINADKKSRMKIYLTYDPIEN